MTVQPIAADPAQTVSAEFARNGFGPYFATPCGILAPLLARLESQDGFHTVSREDNAIGQAAGSALAGRLSVALMQNSGFGQSINALASLVVPYEVPILLVISMRGIWPDTTPENLAMGRATVPILNELGIRHETLTSDDAADQIATAKTTLTQSRRPTALLIKPETFGWKV